MKIINILIFILLLSCKNNDEKIIKNEQLEFQLNEIINNYINKDSSEIFITVEKFDNKYTKVNISKMNTLDCVDTDISFKMNNVNVFIKEDSLSKNLFFRKVKNLKCKENPEEKEYITNQYWKLIFDHKDRLVYFSASGS